MKLRFTICSAISSSLLRILSSRYAKYRCGEFLQLLDLAKHLAIGLGLVVGLVVDLVGGLGKRLLLTSLLVAGCSSSSSVAEGLVVEDQDSIPADSLGLVPKAPFCCAFCLLGVAVVYLASTLGESDSRLTRTADELQHTQSLLETQV